MVLFACAGTICRTSSAHTSDYQTAIRKNYFDANWTLEWGNSRDLVGVPSGTVSGSPQSKHICFLFLPLFDFTCKRGSVGQSKRLPVVIPRLSVRFRLKKKNSNSHGFELHSVESISNQSNHHQLIRSINFFAGVSKIVNPIKIADS